jgi:carbamoyltransferase
MLTAGLGGAARHGCVALSDGERLLGVCEQERITRMRGAGFNATGLPDEALDTLLQRLGCARTDVDRYVSAEPGPELSTTATVERIDHHLAHACAAYLTSPFPSAAIVVCDEEAPDVSVWLGRGADVRPVEWSWTGPGFADLYLRCATLLGFGPPTGGRRLEALARLDPDGREAHLADLLTLGQTGLVLERGWERFVEQRLASGGHSPMSNAGLAAALQTRVAELLVEFLASVRERTGSDHVCLAGSLFYHSAINTAIKCHGPFADVFVPIDPGNSGLAVGTALHAAGRPPHQVSPFLGPAYAPDEIKETVDNCKLSYTWESEENAIGAAVKALVRGNLVGWFEGAMEWGPRALGARCILASPFAPFVLENLNRFLKRREPWRGYALSGLGGAVTDHFDGPRDSPFMECDYRPRDPSRFQHILPNPNAVVRMHTAGSQSPAPFLRLLEAFGEVSGMPILVNTSFNGFHEPIVCSPRDAVRVFYGTGLDMLVLGQFLLTK